MGSSVEGITGGGDGDGDCAVVRGPCGDGGGGGRVVAPGVVVGCPGGPGSVVDGSGAPGDVGCCPAGVVEGRPGGVRAWPGAVSVWIGVEGTPGPGDGVGRARVVNTGGGLQNTTECAVNERDSKSRNYLRIHPPSWCSMEISAVSQTTTLLCLQFRILGFSGAFEHHYHQVDLCPTELFKVTEGLTLVEIQLEPLVQSWIVCATLNFPLPFSGGRSTT